MWPSARANWPRRWTSCAPPSANWSPSEKLAAVGQLTAGVAHEINNPIAVIQGNIEVLADILGTQADPVREETPHPRPGYTASASLPSCCSLRAGRVCRLPAAGGRQPAGAGQPGAGGHQMKKANVAVVEDFRATQPLTINPSELQQVLINLMVNAMQAMPGGGTLTYPPTTGCKTAPLGVRIDVADSGTGIAPEVLAHIFNPFFTTKKSRRHRPWPVGEPGLMERWRTHQRR